MVVRPAVAGDAGQVADVDLAARVAALPNVRWALTPEQIRQWISETLLPSGAVHVADDRGTLLGYITLRDAWVDQLYVRPGNWRGGVGSCLLRFAMDRNPRGLTLYCFQCNLTARRFYEHHGFTAIGFTDGTDNDEQEPDVLFSWPGRPVRLAPAA
jgi:GNAT superfamily N-acetyltransferase